MSSNEVATVMELPLMERMTYAKALAESDAIPKAYRGKPANVLIAMEYGAAIGLPPAISLAEIHVVDGRPGASAKVIAGLVRKAGHRLRVTFDSKTSTATAIIIRHDDPDFEWVATWSMDDAKTAELTHKDNWKHYPRNMLKARAVTEVARDACAEALHGVAYTPEELEDLPKITVERVDVPAPAPSADRLIPQGGDTNLTVDTSTGEILDAEVVPDGLEEFTRTDSDAITPAQLSELARLFKALGINNKVDGLQMVHNILGADGAHVENTKQLTAVQADLCIETMTGLANAKQPATTEVTK